MNVTVTPKWVEGQVESVRAGQGDNEYAHHAEDVLYETVLRAIAIGECYDPQECARIALTTQEIDFERWYA